MSRDKNGSVSLGLHEETKHTINLISTNTNNKFYLFIVFYKPFPDKKALVNVHDLQTLRLHCIRNHDTTVMNIVTRA